MSKELHLPECLETKVHKLWPPDDVRRLMRRDALVTLYTSPGLPASELGATATLARFFADVVGNGEGLPRYAGPDINLEIGRMVGNLLELRGERSLYIDRRDITYDELSAMQGEDFSFHKTLGAITAIQRFQ
jgi:hypothetical protein